MLSFLRGIVVFKSYHPHRCTLDVGGWGVSINIGHRLCNSLITGQESTIYTNLQLGTDAIKLYGFADAGELAYFQLITSLKGVGPKLGMSILDALSAQSLYRVVSQDKFEELAGIPGIGKKMAERILFELKGKLDDVARLPTSQGPPDAVAPEHADTVDVLRNLGYSHFEVKRALAEVLRENTTLDGDELLKRSLQWLSTNC